MRLPLLIKVGSTISLLYPPRGQVIVCAYIDIVQNQLVVLKESLLTRRTNNTQFFSITGKVLVGQ
jgi:hypothetical protein